MPAFRKIQISRRASPYDNPTSTSFSPISIVGFILAGLVILTILISCFVRYVRKRNAAKRESRIGAAFLDVKGLVLEEKQASEEKPRSELPSQFSRSNLTQSIILPSKAYTRSSPSTLQSYPSDIPPLPTARPFAPFGFALDAHTSRASSIFSHTSEGTGIRFSMASLFSVASASTTNGSMIGGGSTDTRKVHRPFTSPVLPDELLVTRVGERLMIIHSYDDGWCAVGRKGLASPLKPKSLFGGDKEKDPYADVEVGVVPAWCFMKPVQGVTVERPVRGSSLGVADPSKLGSQQDGERDGVISWSNFS